MPSAVASAMPGEDEPAYMVNATRMPSWNGAGVHYVCHMWYSSSVLSASGCMENNSEVHLLLLLQPSNNAHNASPPRSARLKRRHLRSNRCPVHCLCPPPRPARARIHSSRDCSHHRDIAYDLACYKHTRIPQDIGLLRQTPLSISALSTCARHSAEITFQNGIPRPRIP